MISSFAFVYLPTGVFMLLFVAVFIFALYAQIRVSSAYGKNSRILSRGRITGREAAQAVMAHAGVTDVEITETSGHLTDHYDPMHKRLVFRLKTIAAPASPHWESQLTKRVTRSNTTLATRC